MIDGLSGCVQAVFALVLRAQAVATPSLARVEAVLDRHSEAERVATSRQVNGPEWSGLDAAVAREAAERAAARAIADQVDVINAEIGNLVRAQKARGRSLWSRWFRDTETNTRIANLRGQRVTLQAHHAIAQRKHLQTIADESVARRSHTRANAERDAERNVALQASKARLAVVERARTLLKHWPALAYAGARRLLAMAARVEKAHEKGWDPGSGKASDLAAR